MEGPVHYRQTRVKQLIRTKSALNPTGFLLLGGGVQEQVELGSGCVMEGVVIL